MVGSHHVSGLCVHLRVLIRRFTRRLHSFVTSCLTIASLRRTFNVRRRLTRGRLSHPSRQPADQPRRSTHRGILRMRLTTASPVNRAAHPREVPRPPFRSTAKTAPPSTLPVVQAQDGSMFIDTTPIVDALKTVFDEPSG
jgi:hypothetical protein